MLDSSALTLGSASPQEWRRISEIYCAIRKIDELGPWAETNGQESGYRSMINSSIRWRNDLMLTMPVKRRWAMVATNPIEE
jgi:hypothetical protein